MSRKVADCRDFPSDNGCTLAISGEEDEVVLAATRARGCGARPRRHRGGPGVAAPEPEGRGIRISANERRRRSTIAASEFRRSPSLQGCHRSARGDQHRRRSVWPSQVPSWGGGGRHPVTSSAVHEGRHGRRGSAGGLAAWLYGGGPYWRVVVAIVVR